MNYDYIQIQDDNHGDNVYYFIMFVEAVVRCGVCTGTEQRTKKDAFSKWNKLKNYLQFAICIHTQCKTLT